MAESQRNSPTVTLLRELTRAYQAITAWGAGAVADSDLPVGEFDVVMTLGNTDGMRMCDLAAHTLTTPPNVTRLVKSLEAKGMVERRRNPESEREVIARLSPAGEACFEEHYPRIVEFWRRRFSEIYSDTEERELIALLAKLLEWEPEGAGEPAS